VVCSGRVSKILQTASGEFLAPQLARRCLANSQVRQQYAMAMPHVEVVPWLNDIDEKEPACRVRVRRFILAVNGSTGLAPTILERGCQAMCQSAKTTDRRERTIGWKLH
jgi:hypothetical protein